MRETNGLRHTKLSLLLDGKGGHLTASECQPLLRAAVRLEALGFCFVESTVDIVRTSPLRQSVVVSRLEFQRVQVESFWAFVS